MPVYEKEYQRVVVRRYFFLFDRHNQHDMLEERQLACTGLSHV
jgi:hypothetical protein